MSSVAALFEHLPHLGQELKLVREFHIGFRIRDVAAGRYIEIVEFDPAFEGHAHMPGILLAAKALGFGPGEGEPRENGDPVVALLAVDRLVDVAELLQRFGRKEVVDDLRLLQAENVRGLRPQESCHLAEAQPDGVDVPGRELQFVIPSMRFLHDILFRQESVTNSDRYTNYLMLQKILNSE